MADKTSWTKPPSRHRYGDSRAGVGGAEDASGLSAPPPPEGGAVGGRGWGLGEEVPAPRELGTTGAVGEEAEVANADKAVRDDVKEKATDEFLGRERHDLHAVAVGVVSPAEAHDALGVPTSRSLEI